MFVMLTDELFRCCETIPATLTGLCFGEAKLEYPALLILLEFCIINIFAADISWKVILLQLKGHTPTEWQFHVAHSAPQSLLQRPIPSLHTSFLDPLTSVIAHKDIVACITYSKTLLPSPVTCIPIHACCPSTSLKVSAVQPSPTAINIFAVKETSFPLSSVNLNAPDGELRHLSHCSNPQRSSSYR
jgi:hypothetical protein